MRRVSSRQRLVSWDAFDATVQSSSSSSSSPNGEEHDHRQHHHQLHDDDSSSLSDYETCYDTLPSTPTPTSTTTTTAAMHTTAAAAVATKMMMMTMNRVSSIGSNLSQEADGAGGAGGGVSSFLKRKRACRSKILRLEQPPHRSSVPVMTSNNSNIEEEEGKMITSLPSPTIVPTFLWEVDVAPTASFYSVREDDFVTPPTTPSGAAAAATSSSSTTTTTTASLLSPPSSTTTTTNIACLPDDVQLHLLSFLAVDDIRRMTQTGRLYNRLIFGADQAACALWKNLCRQQWSYLNDASAAAVANSNNDNDAKSCNTNMELVDTLHVGSRQQEPDNGSSSSSSSSNRPNLNLLLRLAAASPSIPTSVDKTLFQPKRWTRSFTIGTATNNLRGGVGGGGRFVTLRSTTTQPAAAAAAELQERLAPNGRLAVQFVGTVGTGDRCIRANHPLPRPKLLTKSQVRQIQSRQRQYGAYSSLMSSSMAAAAASSVVDSSNTSSSSLSSSSSMVAAGGSSSSPAASALCGGSFMQRLRRTSRRLAASSSSYSSSSSGHVKPIWQPFVAPFYVRSSSNGDKSAVVSVTPRLVAYFEVSILEAPTMTAQDAEDRRRRQQQQVQGQQQHHAAVAPWRLAAPTFSSTTECVAVGLARGEFSLHTRMPGWDADSYGYHGDDGGIFHNAGHMIRPFGPKFGVGDVVGCGIDYQEQSIFYTLNGTFLGYAFDKIDKTSLEQDDLYPVVGMDTNCLVQVNFGTSGQAFQYNLDAKIDSHKQVICEALRPITNM